MGAQCANYPKITPRLNRSILTIQHALTIRVCIVCEIIDAHKAIQKVMSAGKIQRKSVAN